MKVKLFTAPTEIDASIIKGVLENAGIKSAIGPGEGSLTLQARSQGPNVPHDIFVGEDRVKEAFEILKEGGWLSNTA